MYRRQLRSTDKFSLLCATSLGAPLNVCPKGMLTTGGADSKNLDTTQKGEQLAQASPQPVQKKMCGDHTQAIRKSVFNVCVCVCADNCIYVGRGYHRNPGILSDMLLVSYSRFTRMLLGLTFHIKRTKRNCFASTSAKTAWQKAVLTTPRTCRQMVNSSKCVNTSSNNRK